MGIKTRMITVYIYHVPITITSLVSSSNRSTMSRAAHVSMQLRKVRARCYLSLYNANAFTWTML